MVNFALRPRYRRPSEPTHPACNTTGRPALVRRLDGLACGVDPNLRSKQVHQDHDALLVGHLVEQAAPIGEGTVQDTRLRAMPGPSLVEPNRAKVVLA